MTITKLDIHALLTRLTEAPFRRRSGLSKNVLYGLPGASPQATPEERRPQLPTSWGGSSLGGGVEVGYALLAPVAFQQRRIGRPW
jgi:hypothetical protein